MVYCTSPSTTEDSRSGGLVHPSSESAAFTPVTLTRLSPCFPRRSVAVDRSSIAPDPAIEICSDCRKPWPGPMSYSYSYEHTTLLYCTSTALISVECGALLSVVLSTVRVLVPCPVLVYSTDRSLWPKSPSGIAATCGAPD